MFDLGARPIGNGFYGGAKGGKNAHTRLVWPPFDPSTNEGPGSSTPNEVRITTMPSEGCFFETQLSHVNFSKISDFLSRVHRALSKAPAIETFS